MIGDVEGSINETDHTVSVALPSGSDITSLEPVIKISENATISPESGYKVNFTNPVDYTVTAEDGTTQVYVVTVTADTENKNENTKNEAKKNIKK